MKRNNKLKVELFTHTEKSAILTVVEIIYCIIEKEKKEMESCSHHVNRPKARSFKKNC